ncbi:MAG: SpoIIE family protein phosphatase, partial [Candidatus Eremiobacteraeota bacterium]|nr:SpoIIE family protein phosphatase [Candidatus Eremiobacteraeota bacterium]
MALSILLPTILSVATISIYLLERQAGTMQREIRRAQIERSTALNLQLDEEAAVRGYSATHERAFLSPYDRALPRLGDVFRSLKFALRVTPTVEDDRLAEDEQAINARWLHEVALPLISNPSRNSQRLMLQGKNDIDQFRRDDRRMQQILAIAADRADARSAQTTSRVLLFSIGSIGLVVAILIAATVVQFRLTRELGVQRQAYLHEKRIADVLQSAILEKTLPVHPELKFDAVYIPASREAAVGGDWYDAVDVGDGRILFSLGDVTGHGLTAALIMSAIRQSILVLGQHEKSPAEVLRKANATLRQQFPDTMATAICGFAMPAERRLLYANAGHPPPLLVTRDGTFLAQPFGSLPLGFDHAAAYDDVAVTPAPASSFLLYTDGLTEYDRNIIAGEAVLERETRALARSGRRHLAKALA